MKLSSTRQFLIAGLVLLAALLGAYVRFFWLPTSAQKTELRRQIADAADKIVKAEAQASRLKRLQDDLAALNRQAVEAEKRLPKAKEVPDVLVALSNLASQHGVTILNFSPGPQKSQQYFVELNYPMSVSGTYHNLGRFLAAIALEQRIFNVQNVNFPSAGADGRMTATFLLIAYQYKG